MALYMSAFAITDFALAVLLGLLSLKWHRKEPKKLRIYFFLLSLSFFAAGILEATFGQAPAMNKIHALQALFSAGVLSVFASEVSGAKKLKTVSAFLILLLVIMPGPGEITRATYLVSILISFVSYFALYELSGGRLKMAGLLGLAASGAGAIIFFAGIPGATLEKFWFAPSAFLAASFGALIAFGEDTILPAQRKRIHGGNALRDIKPLLHLITYLTLMNVVLVLGTLALHEAGHFWVGSKYSCTGSAVLFGSGESGPRTLLSCPPDTPETVLALSGFLFVLPFAAIFLFLKGYPERNFGLVSFGLGLVMGSLDFSLALGKNSIPYALLISGMLLVCAGELLLINAYISPEKKKEA